MIGFCGAVDFESNAVKFSTLKRMCSLHKSGCAFIKNEFGILSDCCGDFEENTFQPVTLKYNGFLYTAAVNSRRSMSMEGGSVAQGILEGYFEVGEEFICRLDFPYALALYDGRCGELLLAKGSNGDRPLFYTQKDGALYFASSLKPLFRLYGGCVRVKKNVLISFIKGGYGVLPQELFADISPIKRGQSLLCSRLGYNVIPTPSSMYSYGEKQKNSAYKPEFSKKTDIRRVLTDALFAFEYPQFDCYMASLLPYIAEARRNGVYEIFVRDIFADTKEDYSIQRADRLGNLWGVDVSIAPCSEGLLSSRQLKYIDKQLDGILDEYMNVAHGMFKLLISDVNIEEIMQERSLTMRIRQKGMLVQSAMWFDTYNIVLV